MDLRRYCDEAAAALRSLEHEESDEVNLAARLGALRDIAADRDVLEECARLKVDLVEVASAIAYARRATTMTPAHVERRGEIERLRNRVLARIRTALHRARATGNDAALDSLKKDKAFWKGLKPPARHAGRLAHAALYRYVVTHHDYLSTGWQKRAALDGLIQEILRVAGLAFGGDYEALRRGRRTLRSRSSPVAGLFRGRTPRPTKPTPGRPSPDL